jgi:hypothetical protein
MRRLIFLSLLLTLFLPFTTAQALSDETDRSVITQELATTCNTETYICYCDGHKADYAATDDILGCSSICGSSYAAENYELKCTNKLGDPFSYSSGPTTSTPTSSTTVEEKADPIIPILNVDVGAVFSPPIVDGAYVETSFLAVYLNAIYKLAMVVCTVLAVVMIMVAGLQYTLARGNPKAITQAKDRMKNAIIGLVLVMSAYTLAYLVDPATTNFASLKIQYVDRIELPDPPPEDMDQSMGSSSEYTGGTTTLSGTNLIPSTAKGANIIGIDVLKQLNVAADAYKSDYEKSIVVTSASRTTQSQATMFYGNCIATGGRCSTGTCDPTGSSFGKSSIISYTKPVFSMIGSLAGLDKVTDKGTITSALIANAKSNYCPHTTNVAVDIWPSTVSGWIAPVADMDNLAKTMTANGFCRLGSEAWHFELNSVKKSTISCQLTNNNSHYGTNKEYPQAGCYKWNYESTKNCCVTATTPSDSTTWPSRMCGKV